MEQKVLPTPQELAKRISDYRYAGVQSGDSRIIKDYECQPVVAYCIGFGGFLCIIKTQMNYLKGYAYGIKNKYSPYPDANYSEVHLDKAVKEIKENTLAVEREFDQEVFEQGRIRPSYDTERPLLAEVIYKERGKITYGNNIGKWDSWKEERSRLVRLKSGKLRAEQNNAWRGNYEKITLSGFLKKLEKSKIVGDVKGGWNDQHDIQRELVSSNVPDEILQECKDAVLLESI